MKTQFPEDSRTGRLWRDMLAEAERSGISAADFEAEVDREHWGGNLHEVRRVTFEDNSIEAVEVFEYAYAHKDCYRLLAKNGFPVNFAMDDFDKSTDVDEKWRKKLVPKLNSIRAEVSDSFGLKTGSDEYRKSLTSRIVTELRSLINLENKICPVEVPDWEALEKRCGACTEFSTILYFSLNHVELEPSFMYAKDSKPVISALTQMAGYVGESSSHALVGVPLESGAMIYADLMSPEIFCKDSEYPFYVRSISTRMFAAIQESQRIGERYMGSPPPGTYDIVMEMCPNDPEDKYLEIRSRMDRMNVEELNFATEQMRLFFPDSALADYLAAVLEADHALHQQRRKLSHVNKVNTALKRLIEVNPDVGSIQLYNKAESYMTEGVGKSEKSLAKERDPSKRAELEVRIGEYKDECMDILSRSVMLNPLWFKSIQLLDRLSDEWLFPAARVELYRSMVEANPDHSHFRFRLAQACVQCAYAASMGNELGKGCDDSEEMVSEAMSHTREIADRLEPDFADAHLLLASAALLASDTKTALAEIDRGIELLGPYADKLTRAQVMLIVKAINIDDGRLADEALNRLQELEPENFPRILFEMCDHLGNFYLRPSGKLLNDDVMVRRARIIGKVIERVETRRPDLADSLWASQAVVAVLLCRGRRRVAEIFRANIGKPESQNVQGSLENFLKYTIVPAFTKSDFKGSRCRDALKIVKYVEEILVPDRVAAVTDAYLIIAEKAVRVGRRGRAKEAMGNALRTGGDAASEEFFERTVRTLFSECVSDDLPRAKLGGAFKRLWAALNVMWCERERLSRDALSLLRIGYENTKDICDRLKDRASARTAAKRVDELTRMIEG